MRIADSQKAQVAPKPRLCYACHPVALRISPAGGQTGCILTSKVGVGANARSGKKEVTVKHWRPYGLGLAFILLVTGCATTDQRILTLKRENRTLESNMKKAETELRTLTNINTGLEKDLAYFVKRASVLDKEKSARIEEAAEIRRGTRGFTDAVMASLQDAYQKAEIVDYIGSELYERQYFGGVTNSVLVDLSHPLPANGTIIGGRAFMSNRGSIQFCLLRPDRARKKAMVVAISNTVGAEEPGVRSWNFDVPMRAREGDVIGIFSQSGALIPYDDADTGHVISVPGPIERDREISIKADGERRRRAYSFGVVGYLKNQ